MLERDRNFSDFKVGDYITFVRRFDAGDFSNFVAISGDRNPLHADKDYAARSRFGAPIVPIHLAAAPFSAIAGMMLPGHRSLYLGSEMRAFGAISFDQEISYSARIVSMHEASRSLVVSVIAYVGADVVLAGRISVQVRDDVPAEAAPARDPTHIPRYAGPSTVLVTGANGSIGRAVARALARKGCGLVLSHRGKSDRIQPLVQDCIAVGITPRTVSGDLASAADVEAIAGACAGVNAIVHTASPAIGDDRDSLFQVNYSAFEALVRAVVPNMLGQQSGSVILLGSAAVQVSPRGWENYVASKAAAMSVVEALRKRYQPWGVKAVTLAPGFVETSFSEAWRTPGEIALLPEEVAEQVLEAMFSENAAAGGYVSLGSRGARHGRFGFHMDASGPESWADGDRDRSQPANPGSKAATIAENGRLDQIVRKVLNLPINAPLADAALDQTPGWDSLRHLELMMTVEESYGLRFTGAEIERTKCYTDLRALIVERIGNTSSGTVI